MSLISEKRGRTHWPIKNITSFRLKHEDVRTSQQQQQQHVSAPLLYLWSRLLINTGTTLKSLSVLTDSFYSLYISKGRERVSWWSRWQAPKSEEKKKSASAYKCIKIYILSLFWERSNCQSEQQPRRISLSWARHEDRTVLKGRPSVRRPKVEK